MPRMHILNSVEREAFDSPPVFTSAQRKQYFDCPSPVRRRAASLRHPTHRLGLLLSAGYFKATKRFFPPSTFHSRDIDYVVRQLEPNAPTVGAVDYHPRTQQRHQSSIRAFYGFRVFTADASRLLLKDIASMVQSHVKPKVIFWRCVDLLVRECIEVPGYTRLTKLILGAINRRSHDLAAILEDALARDVRALLDQLLTQEPVEGTAAPGKTSAYKLTLMKQLSQSSKPSKVKERVADWDVVRDLYDQVTPALHALALKPGGIVYYARIVLRSEIFQLTRRNDPDRYLHLIAFLTHHYYRLQDNLVDTLLASLRNFQHRALRAHKEQCYAQREQRHDTLQALVGELERGLMGTLMSIGSIPRIGCSAMPRK